MAYLISASQRLIRAANRTGPLSEAHRDDLESAIADVVLLGEPGEAEAARLFLVEFRGEALGRGALLRFGLSGGPMLLPHCLPSGCLLPVVCLGLHHDCPALLPVCDCPRDLL